MDESREADDGKENQQNEEWAPHHPGHPPCRRLARRQHQLVDNRDEDGGGSDERADGRISYDLDRVQIDQPILTAGPACRAVRGLFLRNCIRRKGRNTE